MEDRARKTMRQIESDKDRLCRSIQREMHGEMTTRFFRSLPLFQANDALPAPFGDLLARLDDRDDGGRLRRC